jgi:hypothetical protein
MSSNPEAEIPVSGDSPDNAQAAVDAPLALTHAEMNAAYDAGQAVPLSASTTWVTRYQNVWWVVYERGWLRVTDTATAQDLDQAAARLARTEQPPGA